MAEKEKVRRKKGVSAKRKNRRTKSSDTLYVNSKGVLTRDEAKKYSGKGETTFKRLYQEGILPAYKDKFDMSRNPTLYFRTEDLDVIKNGGKLVRWNPPVEVEAEGTNVVEDTSTVTVTEAQLA